VLIDNEQEDLLGVCFDNFLNQINFVLGASYWYTRIIWNGFDFT
jgi:hypothetical protein